MKIDNMGRVIKKLAEIEAFSSIENPIEWDRIVREDYNITKK